MASLAIHANRSPFSGSDVLNAFADAMTAAKREHGMTDAALGDVLNRSPDQARAYRLGDAEVGLIAFCHAAHAFGEALNPVLALTGFRLTRIMGGATCDHRKAAKLSGALNALLVGLADGTLEDSEVRDAADEIYAAGRAIDELRERVARVS